jgi:hypothetical protein
MWFALGRCAFASNRGGSAFVVETRSSQNHDTTRAVRSFAVGSTRQTTWCSRSRRPFSELLLTALYLLLDSDTAICVYVLDP